MRMIIAGAGRGGSSLAIHLQQSGHVVTLVERDPVVGARASEQFGIVVLQGDATEVSTLRLAQPDRADVVLGMLHRDADNLAVALLARALGAKRVMVRMRDVEYRKIYEDAGVHQILSETEILVGALATAIEHEAVTHSMVLGSGEAVAAEIAIGAASSVVGRTVSEVAQLPHFPRSCVIAGMWTGGSVQAPRGASVLEADMRILLVTARADLGRAIDLFLGTEQTS